MRVRSTFEAVVLGVIGLSLGKACSKPFSPDLKSGCTMTENRETDPVDSFYYLPVAQVPVRSEFSEKEIKLLQEKDKVRHELVENIVNLLCILERGVSSGQIKLEKTDSNNVRDDFFQLSEYIFTAGLNDNNHERVKQRINYYIKCCSNLEDKLALYCFKAFLPQYRDAYFPIGETLRKPGKVRYLKLLANRNQLTVIETVRLTGAALYPTQAGSFGYDYDIHNNLNTLVALYPSEYSLLRDKLFGSAGKEDPTTGVIPVQLAGVGFPPKADPPLAGNRF